VQCHVEEFIKENWIVVTVSNVRNKLDEIDRKDSSAKQYRRRREIAGVSTAAQESHLLFSSLLFSSLPCSSIHHQVIGRSDGKRFRRGGRKG
jgi:hypothetical protein